MRPNNLYTIDGVQTCVDRTDPAALDAIAAAITDRAEIVLKTTNVPWTGIRVIVTDEILRRLDDAKHAGALCVAAAVDRTDMIAGDDLLPEYRRLLIRC